MESAKKEILTLADDLTASVGVNFKTVTASLNDLLAVMRTINEFVMGEKELPVEFGATLDEFNNRVVVTFYKENENDNEEELVKLFNENVVNSPLITYDFTYEIPTEEAYTIYPGSTGLNGDAGASWNVQFSTGYKARYYDSANQVFVYGFVTAAHALSGNGADVYYGNGSQQIGEVTKYYYSGNLDFAFVEPVGGSTVSNLIGQSYMQSTGIGNFYVGSTIKKYGYYTYLTTGSVYSTSHTWSSNQTDFALASYDSQNGDSGGIVYITTNNLHYAIGVHKGRMTVDGTTYGCFCKASNISTYGLVNPAN